MMETIAILLIFFIMAIMVLLFFIRTQTYTKQNEVDKNYELESIRVAQAISFLPELQCASKNIIQENCFDTYKMNAFVTLADKEVNYYDQLYYSIINVRSIYPINQTWTLYNKPRQGASSYKINVPVSLYDPVTDKHSYGLLEVTYHTVE